MDRTGHACRARVTLPLTSRIAGKQQAFERACGADLFSQIMAVLSFSRHKQEAVVAVTLRLTCMVNYP